MGDAKNSLNFPKISAHSGMCHLLGKILASGKVPVPFRFPSQL